MNDKWSQKTREKYKSKGLRLCVIGHFGGEITVFVELDVVCRKGEGVNLNREVEIGNN